MQASRNILQLLSAVRRGQFNVQWLRETTDFQYMEANNGAVCVHWPQYYAFLDGVGDVRRSRTGLPPLALWGVLSLRLHAL